MAGDSNSHYVPRYPKEEEGDKTTRASSSLQGIRLVRHELGKHKLGLQGCIRALFSSFLFLLFSSSSFGSNLVRLLLFYTTWISFF